MGGIAPLQTPFYIADKRGRQNWVYFDLRTDVIGPPAGATMQNAPVAAAPKAKSEPSQTRQAVLAPQRPEQAPAPRAGGSEIGGAPPSGPRDGSWATEAPPSPVEQPLLSFRDHHQSRGLIDCLVDDWAGWYRRRLGVASIVDPTTTTAARSSDGRSRSRGLPAADGAAAAE